jgi:BirA family transcriptional regulator, biotin operon repressor / biotin---[acetyl-CoA-carboxylase] ligase
MNRQWPAFGRGAKDPLGTQNLRAQVDNAVTAGVVPAGLAHRVILADLLLSTLPRTGSVESPPRSPISGEQLAGILGLSRAAVHKHVSHMRDVGFDITSTPGAGYVLERPYDDLVVPEAVLPFLLGQAPLAKSTWVAGLPFNYLPRCQSTNHDLKQRADKGVRSGSLLLTDEQTAGRGRLGRVWTSEAGKDLTFSVFIRPGLAPAQAHLLSLAAALAVAEALEMIPGLSGSIAVKWPNDVLLADEKVCGILLEGSIDDDRLNWAVAGLGLNVNSTPSIWFEEMAPEEAKSWMGRPRPTSLRERLGRDIPRLPLLVALLGRLTSRWSELEAGGHPVDRPSADLVASLKRLDALAGHDVEILSAPDRREVVASGKASGIGPEGQLLVRSHSGQILEVFAGDVTVNS